MTSNSTPTPSAHNEILCESGSGSAGVDADNWDAETPKYVVRVVVSVWDLAYDFPVWDTDFVVLDYRDTKRVIHKIEQSYKDLVNSII